MTTSNLQPPTSNLQKGQTLIETLAALFILVMGVSAAVGLAIYALNSSTSIVKEIIATGLAREGVEAVRNMRDTNWLTDSLSVPPAGCYDFTAGLPNRANCYVNWIGDFHNNIVPYCINPTQSAQCHGDGPPAASYYLSFDAAAPNLWALKKDTSKFGLNFDSSMPATGFYNTPSNGVACDNSAGRAEYCRKITLTKINSAPFDQDTGPLLKVQSQVWWTDRNCPVSADWPGLGTCSVELDTFLTNWKNY